MKELIKNPDCKDCKHSGRCKGVDKGFRYKSPSCDICRAGVSYIDCCYSCSGCTNGKPCYFK